MELDKRIKEGKRPLNCFDTEQAKQFIGKKCYFSDDARDFMNLDKADGDTLFYVAELQNIWTAEEYCFADNSNDWCFILPCEWVEEEKKEPEKKYRPFTLAEWIGQHTIGDVIRYRCKSQKIELRHLYAGYAYSIGTDIKNTTSGTLILGVASYTMDYLLEDYEIEVNGEWLPFGVIDE